MNERYELWYERFKPTLSFHLTWDGMDRLIMMWGRSALNKVVCAGGLKEGADLALQFPSQMDWMAEHLGTKAVVLASDSTALTKKTLKIVEVVDCKSVADCDPLILANCGLFFGRTHAQLRIAVATLPVGALLALEGPGVHEPIEGAKLKYSGAVSVWEKTK